MERYIGLIGLKGFRCRLWNATSTPRLSVPCLYVSFVHFFFRFQDRGGGWIINCLWYQIKEIYVSLSPYCVKAVPSSLRPPVWSISCQDRAGRSAPFLPVVRKKYRISCPVYRSMIFVLSVQEPVPPLVDRH